jgi:glycerophosphoryl diester phosphodiesterase
MDAAPEFARALLLGELVDGWPMRAQAVGATGMNVGRRKLTAAGAVAIKRAGYALSVWTVNDPDEARALVGMGADCIITDAPDVILRGLAA